MPNEKNMIKYTKAYKAMVKVYRAITRHFYPTAFVYNRLLCFLHREYSLFSGQLTGYDDYTARHGIRKQILIPADTAMVYENTFISDEHYREKGSAFESPAVYVSELKEVCIYGGYDIISSEKEIITPVYNQSTKTRWSYTNQLVCIHTNDHVTLKYRKSEKCYDEAVFLCGCSGGNYYHFLVETLPKLALLEEQKLYPGVPILVDKSISKIPSLIEAISMVNATNREILFVEDSTSVLAHRLIYVSALTTAPPNLKRGLYQSAEESVVAYKAVECMKEQIMRQVRRGDDKRIYLARYKSSRQRLQNDKELASVCQEAGFKVVFPDRMSFAEQVSLFIGAEYIIGCAGAAISNTMFSAPKTEVYMIVPRVHDNQFWTTFMRNRGLHPFLIDAKIVSKADYLSGDIYRANRQDIEWVIHNIEGRKNVYQG